MPGLRWWQASATGDSGCLINDSWIAATAIANDMAIVTRDHDFDVVEGVQVIRI